MSAIFWPFAGLLFSLTHPKRLLRIWILLLILWALVFGAAFFCAWYLWPVSSNQDWIFWGMNLSWLFGLGLAIMCAIAIPLISWLFIFPLLSGFILEHLQRTRISELLADKEALPVEAGFSSGLSVYASTLPKRFLGLLSGLGLSFLVPPIGILYSAWISGYFLNLDCADSACALLGLNAQERKTAFKEHRQELLFAGIGSGALQTLLSLSIIGLLFLLPAVGTAMTQFSHNLYQKKKQSEHKNST